MSTTYTIQFVNERAVDGKYSVFTAPPILSNSSKVHTNSWMSFPTGPSGTFQIDVTMDFFAWIGTSPTVPVPGVVVRTGQTAPITLGKTSIPMLVKDGYSSFNLGAITTDAIPSAFGIVTGTDFSVPNNKYMIGLAQRNMNGVIAPTASILANNNTTTYITPVVKFFIGEFDYRTGAVVHYSQSSAVSATIDFSSGAGLGYTSAVVRHLSNGKFEIDYVSSGKK